MAKNTKLLVMALEAYDYDVDSSLNDEYIQKHADEYIYGFKNGVDEIDLDFWIQYEDLLGEKISFDEYVFIDKLYDGDPLELDANVLSEYDYAIISELKESLSKYRTTAPNKIDILIKNAESRCEELNKRAVNIEKYELDKV